MLVNYKNSLEVLIEELNNKKMVSLTDRLKLKSLLEKEPAQNIAHIITMDLKLGKACLPEINEWARNSLQMLSKKEMEACIKFLPTGYFVEFLYKD